ncbi:hypothetical protein S83_070848 [Arachis hypogaea]|nr:putative E3 ubiquitin-protein ligase [Arachis hypogaea]
MVYGEPFFYACNRYEAKKQEGVYDETERREMAKNSLERYTHYYERWASNQSSRQKALADLHQMQTVHVCYITFAIFCISLYLPFATLSERMVYKIAHVSF